LNLNGLLSLSKIQPERRKNCYRYVCRTVRQTGCLRRGATLILSARMKQAHKKCVSLEGKKKGQSRDEPLRSPRVTNGMFLNNRVSPQMCPKQKRKKDAGLSGYRGATRAWSTAIAKSCSTRYGNTG